VALTAVVVLTPWPIAVPSGAVIEESSALTGRGRLCAELSTCLWRRLSSASARFLAMRARCSSLKPCPPSDRSGSLRCVSVDVGAPNGQGSVSPGGEERCFAGVATCLSLAKLSETNGSWPSKATSLALKNSSIFN
jgi:hypothetical protein